MMYVNGAQGDSLVSVAESSDRRHVLLKCWEYTNQTITLLTPKDAELLAKGLLESVKKLKKSK